MGADQMQNWVAYCSLQDDDFKAKLENEIHMEKQKILSDYERAQELRALFGGGKI